ncbi:hypothetical protein AMJ85_07225 [candidate division BRC1 bacterium SM23_51]|nr:MAG: hypothetical protein AMJ85_07225 [candidate division BRC1 bacterium SM23_51]
MAAVYRWSLLAIWLLAAGCAPITSALKQAAPPSREAPQIDTRYDFGGFLAPGNWYRGNLHLHSTISDGELDPPETVGVYRKAGYDFVALTDHIGGFRDEDTGVFRPLVYPLEQLNAPRFLVLPGIEYNTNRDGEVIHFVVVGPGYDKRLEEREDLSHAVRKWWDSGAFVFLAHPHWSLDATAVSEDLTFLPAVEVFNYGVEVGEGDRSNSQLHWDRLLRKSQRVLGVATDDAHQPDEYACGGWVVVKAGALSAGEIVKVLRAGQFYFSSGPTLKDVFFDTQGNLHVRCSPVKVIRAISTVGKSVQVEAGTGRNLRRAVLEWDWKHWRDTEAPFVRVECIDKHGQTAWTQAVLPAPAK